MNRRELLTLGTGAATSMISSIARSATPLTMRFTHFA
jgi:hypothetical protein